jgi:predicted nucleic acid-binding protein
LVYLDTSAIIKLYFKEEYSLETSNWVRKNGKAIPLTSFHELEFLNAVNLKQFRKEFIKEDADSVVSKFKKHEEQGIFFRPQLDWTDIFEISFNLSLNFTRTIGSRSLDILHIASALSIKAGKFLTFDDRQARLASLAGIKIVKLT